MPRKILWTPAAIALLGSAIDSKVAKKLGCSASSVRQKREKLGISNRSQICKWGLCELNMLGRYSDEEVAKITGRNVAEVIAKRNELNR
jgi:hypothetical protein